MRHVPTGLAPADGVPAAADLAHRLAAMVRLPTIAGGERDPLDDAGREPFRQLEALLREFYPRVFGAAEVARVGVAGLLLRIPANDDDADADADAGGANHDAGGANDDDAGGASRVPPAWRGGPWVLMAHQDVVPAPRQGEDWAGAGWSHPPFAGVIAPDAAGELTVYGRGTLDDKGALLVLCEAVDSLLEQGWRPPRDLYLLFGADEEREGCSAKAAVEVLRERGVHPHLVLDEGGAVVADVFPGLRRPVAVVGIAEKGAVTLQIAVVADPARAGHAATPPRHAATAGLGRAIAALEDSPHPPVASDVTLALLETIAPHLSGPLGAAAARAGSARGVVAAALARMGGELAATVRTTTAVTELTGAPAPNVIAARATATVNMRVRPGESVADAVAHVDRVVQRAVHGRLARLGRGRLCPRLGRGRGLTARVDVLAASEASPASPLDERWDAIVAAIESSYPDAVAVPYTMLQASDSRYLVPISGGVYRFAPLAMTGRQRAGIHGVDESVTARSLVNGVEFYRALLLGG